MSILTTRRMTSQQLTDRLVSVFGHEAGDVRDVSRRVIRVLSGFTGFSQVRVVLMQGGDLYQDIGRDAAEFQSSETPLLRYVRECAHEAGLLYPLPDSPQHFTDFIKSEGVVAVLPLVFERQLFGWISFHDPDGARRFPRRMIRALESALPLLALGFRTLWVDRILVDRIDELEIINRISRTMNSSLNVKETLESVMDAVIQFSGVDRALMYLIDEEQGYFVPSIGRGMDDNISLDFKVQIDRSIFSEIMREREPLVVTDVLNDERVNPEYAAAVKTKAFVAVPMISKEQVVGIIGVDNYYSDRPVEEIDVDFLITLANHAAIALTNSQLYEQMQGFTEKLQVRVREATDHLHQLLDMKSHFLSIASHQLRTPTTVVKGLLSMLVEDEDTPIDQQRKMIEQAYASTNRLERIISELLTATELDDASSEPFHEEVHAGELLDEIVQQLAPLAEKRNLSLEIRYKEEDPDVSMTTDRFKFTEALANLIDNAIRYTHEGGVTITVETTDEHLEFHVEDTGMGLTEDDQKVIFEKFSRGKRAYEVEPNGTGLGLFIVKRIIEILEGEIKIHSDGKGKGSRFSLRLPRLPVEKG